MSPDDMIHAMSEIGPVWAEAKALAENLSEARKPVLAMLAAESSEKSQAARESEALRRDEYRDHLDALHQARRNELTLQMQVKVIEMQFEKWRTDSANSRRVGV